MRNCAILHSKKTQQFKPNKKNGSVAAYYAQPGNCTTPPYSSYPFCNPDLPTEERVNDLVSRMTLAEKVLYIPCFFFVSFFF